MFFPLRAEFISTTRSGRRINNRLSQKSAKQGYDLGQIALGDCYRRGVGVEVDKEEARKWLQKAADQGNDQAQKTLSTLDVF